MWLKIRRTLNCTLKCNYVGGQHSWKTKLEMRKQVIKVIKTLGGVETELSDCFYIWDAYCGREFLLTMPKQGNAFVDQ